MIFITNSNNKQNISISPFLIVKQYSFCFSGGERLIETLRLLFYWQQLVISVFQFKFEKIVGACCSQMQVTSDPNSEQMKHLL